MYSWQKNQWQNILKQNAKIPHALLLRGRAGTGKHTFALEVSKTMLCQQATELQAACENCASCNWFKEGTHPDFMLITPEDAETADDGVTTAPKKKTAKKTQIAVAKIRQLIDFLSLSSHQSNGYRVIVISPADALNITAANALLKMLEEPPASSLFLLVTSQPQRLLATITSRCQIVDMPTPNIAESLNWLGLQGINNAEELLNLAGGAPLLAMQMNDESDLVAQLSKSLAFGAKLDPFTSAPLFLGLGMDRAIEHLQKWLFDLQAYYQTQTLHYFAAQANTLQALCKSVNLKALLRFQGVLIEAKKTAQHPLSNEVQLENILLQYTKIFHAPN